MKLNNCEVNALSVAVQHRELPHDYIRKVIDPMIGRDAKIVLELMLGAKPGGATKRHKQCCADYEAWLESLR